MLKLKCIVRALELFIIDLIHFCEIHAHQTCRCGTKKLDAVTKSRHGTLEHNASCRAVAAVNEVAPGKKWGPSWESKKELTLTRLDGAKLNLLAVCGRGADT